MNNNPRGQHGNNRVPPQGTGRQPDQIRRSQPSSQQTRQYQRPNSNQLQQRSQADYSRQYTQAGMQQPRQSAPTGYPPVRHKSRRQARRAAYLAVLSIIIMIMLLVSVIIFAARCASGQITGDDTTDRDNTTPPVNADVTNPPETDDTSAETEDETTALAATHEYITKTAADVHRGYQILVNYQNEYVSEGSVFKLQTFYGNKNTSYKIPDITTQADRLMMSRLNEMMTALETETGLNDILITSAYRDTPTQEKLYAARVDMYGEEYAQMFVAMPGHSEHHTGLAADFAVYSDDNQASTFDKMPEYPEWLKANAHRFGFIERYAADKTDFTKIAYENWHYRYIGKPHAFYMVKNNLCLEEYIDLLRSFKFGEKKLAITDDEGVSWEIYFVPADPSGTTQVPVPIYQEYEISGNNVDGFIITVKC